MPTIILINASINIFLIVISSFSAGIYYYFIAGILTHVIFFIFNILTSIIIFYLFFIICSICYCNLIVKLTDSKEGTFLIKNKTQHLRIVSNGILSGFSKPFFSLFPFLISLMNAKVGRGFVLMGKILNPDLFIAGENVLIGDQALFACHIVQSDKIYFGKIVCGNNVTIGIRSVVMPNVVVGNNAIVAANSLVKMGTQIPANEIWGGIPAKKIGVVGK